MNPKFSAYQNVLVSWFRKSRYFAEKIGPEQGPHEFKFQCFSVIRINVRTRKEHKRMGSFV